MATTKADEVSDAASARICSHMNSGHAATVHAMVLSHLPPRTEAASRGAKVQNARMTSVSLGGYSLSYVACDGDACSMNELTVPFDPPLTSAAEVKPRLVRDHHAAFAPRATWLVSDPAMRTLFGACLLLCAGTALGREGLARRVGEAPPWAAAIVATVFGTPARFADLVVGFGYFTLFAHAAEACCTAYLCKVSLKMKTGTTIKWFVLNVCVGFPIMMKVMELVAVDRAARSKAKSK